MLADIRLCIPEELDLLPKWQQFQKYMDGRSRLSNFLIDAEKIVD